MLMTNPPCVRNALIIEAYERVLQRHPDQKLARLFVHNPYFVQIKHLPKVYFRVTLNVCTGTYKKIEAARIFDEQSE
jgi:hypothetical protein